MKVFGLRAALLGVLLSAFLVGAGPTLSDAASTAGSAPNYRCVIDVYGQTGAGRIKFRRVVNHHVQVSRTGRGPAASVV